MNRRDACKHLKALEAAKAEFLEAPGFLRGERNPASFGQGFLAAISYMEQGEKK